MFSQDDLNAMNHNVKEYYQEHLFHFEMFDKLKDSKKQPEMLRNIL